MKNHKLKIVRQIHVIPVTPQHMYNFDTELLLFLKLGEVWPKPMYPTK